MARNKVVYFNETLIDISDTTAVASDVASGKYFYTADGTKTAGAYSPPTFSTQTKTVTPTTSTQTVLPDSGYQGLSSVTVGAIPAPSLQTKTASYTPTQSTQTATITADSGYDGLDEVGITVNPIPSQYITTTDATATASQINSGATAYVNGVKVTGTQVVQTYYTGSSNPSSSTGSDGDLYLKVVS